MPIKNKFKTHLKNNLNPSSIKKLKGIKSYALRALGMVVYPYARFIGTPLNLFNNKKKTNRQLEIGPGPRRVPGFETINVVWGRDVDYIGDASKKLPFPVGSFDIVYASHVLEHTAWYELEATLAEWTRVLKPGGFIEIWIPDGYKLAKLLCDVEEENKRDEWQDNWRPFNPEGNPYKWVNGRILYGAVKAYPSWHTAIITPKFLHTMMSKIGLVQIARMTNSEVRGVDHGWINLGMRGYKP